MPSSSTETSQRAWRCWATRRFRYARCSRHWAPRRRRPALLRCCRRGARLRSETAHGRRTARGREMRAKLDAQWPAAWQGQRRVLEVIQQTLPDAIIAGDSTQPVYSGNHLFEATRTRSWFNSSTGYGTLGYGLPAAIGAKLAAPHAPVICLIGDGGIQFTLPELASSGRSEHADHRPALEQPRLRRDQALHAESHDRAHRRGHLHARLSPAGSGLRVCLRASAELRAPARPARDARRAPTRPSIIEVTEDALFLTADV